MGIPSLAPPLLSLNPPIILFLPLLSSSCPLSFLVFLPTQFFLFLPLLLPFFPLMLPFVSCCLLFPRLYPIFLLSHLFPYQSSGLPFSLFPLLFPLNSPLSFSLPASFTSHHIPVFHFPSSFFPSFAPFSPPVVIPILPFFLSCPFTLT